MGACGQVDPQPHLADAVRRGDHERLRKYFTHYWSSATSVEFYEGFAHRFEELFLRHHSVITDRLGEVLSELGEGPVRLVEVGSGDGKVLEWFAEQLPGISTLHGVDLNDREIRRCRENHRDSSRLFFHTGDLLAWLRANPAPRTVLVTNGGVFEYLLEDELRALFTELRSLCSPCLVAVTNGGVFEYLLEDELRALFTELRSLCSPCLVAVTESIGDDHDLENETSSLPYGHEFAFSHNYPAILREAGFSIHWEKNRPTEPGEENHPVRWYQLVAGSLDEVSRRFPTESLSALLFTATQLAVV